MAHNTLCAFVVAVVHNAFGVLVGGSCSEQCYDCFGACSRKLMSSPTMADPLGVLHSLTVDRRREARGVSPCQGQGSMRPIFVLVSVVPTASNAMPADVG